MPWLAFEISEDGAKPCKDKESACTITTRDICTLMAPQHWQDGERRQSQREDDQRLRLSACNLAKRKAPLGVIKNVPGMQNKVASLAFDMGDGCDKRDQCSNRAGAEEGAPADEGDSGDDCAAHGARVQICKMALSTSDVKHKRDKQRGAGDTRAECS